MRYKAIVPEVDKPKELKTWVQLKISPYKNFSDSRILTI